MQKTVLLAGAAGMTGSAILVRLLRETPSVQIRAIIHERPPLGIDDGGRVEWVRGDLRSGTDCRRMVEGCQTVVMAAAATSGSAVLVREPWRQINDNLFMMAQVLQACALGSVGRLILVGSATIYQESDGAVRETDLDLNRDPFTAYSGVGWVMRYAEKLAAFWQRERGLQVALVRASNIFGPRAKFDPAVSNFIPALVRKAVARMEPFEVWGSADVCRDVVFVEDFADAVICMLRMRELGCEAFNIGSGVRTTVGDVVGWVLKYAGHQPRAWSYKTTGPSTIRHRLLDCSKAREQLGWTPLHTVEQGIEITVRWWERNAETWRW